MVCVPCIVIPVFLYVWYRFLYPLICKVWDPAPLMNRYIGWPPLEDSQKKPAEAKKCPFGSSSPGNDSKKDAVGGGDVKEETKKEQ